MNKCAICGGSAKPGRTTVSVDTGFGVIVIRDVPANVCSQCGEDWLSDETAGEVEAIIDKARKDKAQIEVLAMAPA